MHAVVAATRVGRMLFIQGHFFTLYIYIIIKVIGTCMQIFKKIDRKNELFSFENLVQCFCGRLYNLQYVQCASKTMRQIFKRKKLGFLAVNLFEILHASTYTI